MQLVAVLVAVAFLQWLIALPFLVVKLGGRYRTVGLFVGCSAVFYAAGSLSLHRFVERYGYRRVLWVALPSVGASTMLCAFAPNLPVLFVLVSILSILLALFWASWECMFSSQNDEGQLLQNMARYCLGFTSGDIIGSWLGTTLVNRDFGLPFLRVRLPFLAAGAVVLICMALLSWIERGGEFYRARLDSQQRTEAVHRGECYLPTTRTLAFFAFCVAGITFSFVPLIVVKEMGDWTELNPRVIALQPMAQAIFFIVLGRWGGWVHKKWPLWLCAIVLILAAMLLCAPFKLRVSHLLGAWCFKLGLILVGASVALAFLTNLLYSMERPATRARNAGIHEAIVGLGMTVGPTIGGYGAWAVGNKGQGALWAGLALAAFGLLMFFLLRSRSDRRDAG